MSAPETLNTTPMPPSHTERPSSGFTTIVDMPTLQHPSHSRIGFNPNGSDGFLWTTCRFDAVKASISRRINSSSSGLRGDRVGIPLAWEPNPRRRQINRDA